MKRALYFQFLFVFIFFLRISEINAMDLSESESDFESFEFASDTEECSDESLESDYDCEDFNNITLFASIKNDSIEKFARLFSEVDQEYKKHKGQTPLMVAAELNKIEIVKFLLGLRKITIETAAPPLAVEAIISCNERHTINYKDNSGQTALMLASSEIAKLLIKHGAVAYINAGYGHSKCGVDYFEDYLERLQHQREKFDALDESLC